MNYNDVTDPGLTITFNPTPVKITVLTTIATTAVLTLATSVPATDTPTPAPTHSPLPLLLTPMALLAGLVLYRR